MVLLSKRSMLRHSFKVFVICSSCLSFVSLGQVMPSQSADWLVHTSTAHAATLSENGEVITLSNGLIQRAFLFRGGAFCTIEYRNLVTRQTFFRAVSPEANITLSGTAFDIGGCSGTPPEHYEFWNPDSLLANLSANPNAFQYKNYTTATPAKLFDWSPGRRHAPKDIAWPPKGLHLSVNFVPPASAPAILRSIVVTVHYELYDSLPALRKWISVASEDASASTIIVDTLVIEMLRAPNFAPERMTVVQQQANNPTPFDQQVAPDRSQSFPGRSQQLWFTDPQYDQCCDQELHVTYTYYTFLVLGYGYNVVYGNNTGPGALVDFGETFTSASIYEILQDSSDTERQGLAIRRMGRVLTPQLLENPINFMITDISSTKTLRIAVDQAAETGMEIVIVGFGAAGWCGMCFNQLRNASFKAWFKREVQYANSRGIEVSAYTLMQHNGWGEVVPLAEQTLSVTGSRGPTACFATDWHASYRSEVLQFIQDVGLGGLETDGQFEGIPCADTSGDHHHNGIEGGFYYGLKATLDFNVALKRLGVYQTGADAYAFSGANKWNHADTDEFGHLAIWEQQTVGRMYIYDSTMSRLPTSGTIGVNDLATSTKGCDRPRVACFDFILGAQYGMGSIPNFRAAKLFDPTDPDAAAMNASISKWNAFYKQWRRPRPSGAAGLLTSELIHVQRPDSRSLEVVVHVTSDSSAAERAIVSFVNPSKTPHAANVTVPLYYAGLPPGSKVVVTHASITQDSVQFNGKSSAHAVGQDGAGFTDIVIPISLPASSNGMALIRASSAEFGMGRAELAI